MQDDNLRSVLQKSLTPLCGSDIPADYLAFVCDYPHGLKHQPRADDRSDSEGVVSDVELLCRADEIVEINQEARATSVQGPDGEEFFWPEQLLIIGETGEGDYFCLDVSGQHAGVLQFRHQALEFEEIAESLSEFVELLVQAYQPD